MPGIITVIIPVYNRAESLGCAVESVLNQRFQDFKLLIIDDGSSDNSLEVAQSYQDTRVHCIAHPANLGLGAAWNTGIQASNTEWLAFLDSDDTWHVDKLDLQVHFAQDNPGMVGCTTGYFHVFGKNTRQIIPTPREAEHRQVLFHDILHLGTTLFIQREAFERFGYFDPTLRRGQDTDWLLRLVKAEQLPVIPQALAWIYQHTQRSAEHLENARRLMIEKHAADYAHYGYIFARRKIASMWADVAYQYERADNWPKMREYALKSLLSFPLQSPGIYLILLDALTGLHTKSLATRLKNRITN
jgi:glycosyltransferase involved in cell wall biosynthesis